MSKISEMEKRILSYDVPTIAKMQEQSFPHIWKRMYTRNVEPPTNYYSHKALACGLTGAIIESRIMVMDQLQSNVGWCAGVLEKYDFPTYYVSEPLVKALLHSAPPKDLTWDKIAFPFPGLTFMLPRGTLREPEEIDGGKDIILVGAVKARKGQQMVIPTVGTLPPMPEERITVFWLVAPSAIIMNDTTFPSTHPLEPIADWIEEKSAGRSYIGPPAKFSAYVAGFVANLLLVMEARKELVEPGELIRKNPREGRPNFHSPTYLGRRYHILRRDSPGESMSKYTELGWRAGHFKRQHFGAGRQEVKTIWVDPYIAFTRGLVPKEGAI